MPKGAVVSSTSEIAKVLEEQFLDDTEVILLCSAALLILVSCFSFGRSNFDSIFSVCLQDDVQFQFVNAI